jgi:hypothetical protein
VWSVGALLLSSHAFADRCPAPEGGTAALATIDASDRIAFLHRTVDGQARYAKTWKWAWFGIGSATFASSVAITVAWAVAGGDPQVQQANIIDNVVVSGFSIVTPITALLFALRVESDAPVIDQLLHDTANGAAGECLVLARMEELFAKDAAEESLNTGWFAQITALLGLGAMFSIMAVEAATASNSAVSQAHWFNAITNTAVGLVLTEAQILTTPTGAASGYKRYLKGELEHRAKKLSLSVAPMTMGPGVSLRLAF